MKALKTGQELADVIRKAISDCEITTSEYDDILSMANADLKVDATEQKLLAQLQGMIANGTIKRVPG
ncbi:MAG: hypothetical protein U5R30_01225 [Deltaproteobacteria bacterium]|nr:hypothetical protein [Deltaproteobacteria bacterium]